MAGRPIRRVWTLVAIVGAAWGSGCVQPFDPPNRDPGTPAPHVASVGGFVRDRVTLQPIVGAVVAATATGTVSTISGADGSYELRDIREAVVMLSTSKEGYETASTQYPLAPGHNARIILLQPLVSTSSPPP